MKIMLDGMHSEHYPGVGNDVRKFVRCHDNLEQVATVRHEEAKIMALTETTDAWV